MDVPGLDYMTHDGIEDDGQVAEPAGCRWIALAVVGLLVGTFVDLLSKARYVAPLQSDDLIYHLAIPGRWLQNGWLSSFTPWFHEPAPAYGPLLVEMLTAVLMVLTGGEFWARLVLIPFQIGVAVLICKILKSMSVRPSLARITGASTLVLGPFLLQTLSFHNDIALTFAFLLAVWGLLHRPLRLQPNGATLAFVGGLALMLAIKYVAIVYTVVLVAVAIVWKADAGRQERTSASRRRAVVAWIALALLMVLGCWTYFRTWWLTGNPVFPAQVGAGSVKLFDGLYSPGQVADYTISWSAIRELFISSVESYTLPVLSGSIALGCALIVSVVTWIDKRTRRGRAWMTVGILPNVCTAAFILLVPFGEPRLLFPVYALVWMAPPILASRFAGRSSKCGWAAVIVVALWVLMTALIGPAGSFVVSPIAVATAVGVVAVSWVSDRLPTRHRRRAVGYASCTAVLVVGAVLFVFEPAMRAEYLQRRSYAVKYGDLGRAWDWLDDATRESPSVIAYTGTAMIYPLLGAHLQNRAVYVHVAPGNHSTFHDYPKSADSQPKASAIELTTTLFRSRFDQEYWLQQFSEQDIDYLLVVGSGGAESMPIEAQWARQRPDLFELSLAGQDALVFRVLDPKSSPN